MEHITTLCNKLNQFLIKCVGSGTTTAIKKIASENDVYVVVLTMREKKEIYNGNATSINDILEDKFRGVKGKPVLIETTTLSHLIDTLAKTNQQLILCKSKNKRLIDGISNLIDNN